MVSCAACGVRKSDQSKSNGITFHVFPRSRIRQEWIDFVNKPNWIRKRQIISVPNILQQIVLIEHLLWCMASKKTISSLKKMIQKLRKKNLILEENENLLLDEFGNNKDIIRRLF
ncbi:hypothetical protein ABEB36_013562 [Hypothenemus hampei]|uniref:THAP-type domain-containing protein n=1 Tax=Hypothenemus hampei TaxID=57062 RepID=A0ABD1E4S3_HYPHA